MKQKFTTPEGNIFSIDAFAEVDIDNGRTIVSVARFPDDLEDTIRIPRNSKGFVKLDVTVDFGTVTIGGGSYTFAASKTVRWDFSKRGRQVEFLRPTMQPYDDYVPPGGPSCAFAQSSDGPGASLSLLITPTWDDDLGSKALGKKTESMPLTVKLDAWDIIGKATILPGLMSNREVTFWPFVTNQSNRLVKGELIQEVTNWFDKLHPITRVMMRDASNHTEMPGGDPLLITGYTSSLGPKSHNSKLGADRALEVKKIIQWKTRNENTDVYRAGSDGELDPTDNRPEENNDPENRKVVVTYWDTAG